MSEKEELPTILIVDDTPANLGVVVDFLEENGFRVVIAQDGKEGVQRAAFIKPDLILLDVMMPGMDGFETCRELKSYIATRDIPVIFMTALADTASKLDGFKAGGVDYITKPLAIEEMLARVVTHVALRTTQIRLDQQNQRLQKEASVRLLTESTLQQAHDELKSVYKRLETAKIQLLHATKMASIGMLARGAAQQIKNPISSLKDHLISMEACIAQQLRLIENYEAFRDDGTLSQQEVEAIKHAKDGLTLIKLEHGALEMINESMHDVEQLEEFGRTFRDLGAAEGAVWQMSSVAHLLDNTLGMIANELDAATKISKNYAELPDIECLPAELMQAFMCILRNAGQAITEEGEIEISTGSENQSVWVDIRDNGVGIPAENLSKIFDPFFSTRPNGKGAGLGLSLSFASIKKHRGRIEVDSTPQVGSSFRIWLPMRQADKG